MNDLDLGVSFLLAQTVSSLVALFWYTLIFDVPRYVLPFAAIALGKRLSGPGRVVSPEPEGREPSSVSVVLIGHNEADSIEACIRSLEEQSFTDFEIVIVSDGSTDRMSQVGMQMVRAGRAHSILSTGVRGGKASGTNLACRVARGDILINIDCDCSFDRYAIENILKPFTDSRVGAVCGDIAPRNSNASLISQFQEIEYLQSISVGKRFSAAIDQVTCASGAFSAFRREAMDQIGGLDVGGGEDLDLTIRLRQAGWRIAFAPDALCYTDVPATTYGYIRQRLRWDRDAVWIRFRKHRRLLNPFHERFRLAEAFHQVDFLFFNVLAAAIFPLYILWLALRFGALVLPILVALQLALLVLDLLMLVLAGRVAERPAVRRNLIFLPGYSVFMSYAMRLVRLIAYVDEWFFAGSHRDNYTPIKVRNVRPW